MIMLTIASYSQPMLASPDLYARQVSECLYGEALQPIQKFGEFTEVKTQDDSYSGFVLTDTLVTRAQEGHQASVNVRDSLLLAEPDEKSSLITRIPLHAQVCIVKDDSQNSASGVAAKTERFVQTCTGHYAIRAHLKFDGVVSRGDFDIVASAKSMFLGAPYVWGGKAPAGCDCSGMLQSAARANDITLPRDSHQQEQAIPLVVEFDDRCRDDVVFWPGHVGVLYSPDHLLHANAFTMSCCVEDLESVIKRAGEPTSIRRLVRT